MDTLDLKTASVIATSLAHSKLDYCKSLYLNLQQKQISRLQLLQNSHARVVTGTPKTKHITPVHKSLHWLKIEERFHYKINFLHTSQLKYFRKLMNIKPAGSTHSSNPLTLLAPPPPLLLKYLILHPTKPLLSSGIIYQNLRTFSNTSPNSATTSQRSSLPLSLSKTQFCSYLKTYLLGISYPPKHSLLLLLTTSISNLTTMLTMYCAAGNRSGHFGLLFLRSSYKFQFYLLYFTYLLTKFSTRLNILLLADLKQCV